MKHHRGLSETLRADSDRKENSFAIKSVKLVACDSGKTENDQAGDSYQGTTKSSLAKSQTLPVASVAPLTSSDSEYHNYDINVEEDELSQSSGAASAFCRPILLMLLLLQSCVSA